MPIKREPKIIDGHELWFCPHCNDWKLKSEYHRYSRSPAGIYYYCRACQNKIVRSKYVRKALRVQPCPSPAS